MPRGPRPGPSFCLSAYLCVCLRICVSIYGNAWCLLTSLVWLTSYNAQDKLQDKKFSGPKYLQF